MRGTVEIWSGDKLLYTKDNMIMDGAGELLADVMTVSPSIANVVGSESLLDASNFMIQAISFGTGEEGYLRNAHYTSDQKNDLITSLVVTNDIPLSQNNQRVYVHLPTANPGYASNGVSSYVPRPGLPVASNPTLRQLEADTRVSGEVNVEYFGTNLLSGALSSTSIALNQGQHMNMLPYSYVSAYLAENTEIASQINPAFSALSESIMQAARGQIGGALGAFADSSATTDKVILQTFSGVEENYDSSNAVTTISDVTGFFNSASSMDVFGYVNMIMSSVPHANYDMSSGQLGLTMSAAPDFSSTGKITYDVNFASGDLIMANLYGGIYNIGLWTIDNIETLKGGNIPPYDFDPVNNPRKYKLFSRNTFNTNLCDIIDVT